MWLLLSLSDDRIWLAFWPLGKKVTKWPNPSHLCKRWIPSSFRWLFREIWHSLNLFLCKTFGGCSFANFEATLDNIFYFYNDRILAKIAFQRFYVFAKIECLEFLNVRLIFRKYLSNPITLRALTILRFAKVETTPFNCCLELKAQNSYYCLGWVWLCFRKNWTKLHYATFHIPGICLHLLPVPIFYIKYFWQASWM